MVRKFVPFDAVTTTAEFRDLDSPHRQKLMYAMERYQESLIDVDPAIVKNEYPEGVLEIRHQNGIIREEDYSLTRGTSLCCWSSTAKMGRKRLSESLTLL